MCRGLGALSGAAYRTAVPIRALSLAAWKAAVRQLPLGLGRSPSYLLVRLAPEVRPCGVTGLSCEGRV